MMNRLIVAIIAGLLTLDSFAQVDDARDKFVRDTTCEIWNEIDFLEPLLFPFSFEEFDSQKMLSYFVEGTRVDSLEFDNEGYKYSIYTFRHESSYLSFLVKPESNWFYMDEYLLQGEFLKSEIYVGVERNRFLEIVGLKNEACETIQFFLGELTSHYTFRFENEILREIYVYSTE